MKKNRKNFEKRIERIFENSTPNMIALISQQFEKPFVDCLARRERKREERNPQRSLEILSGLRAGERAGKRGERFWRLMGGQVFLFAEEEGAIGLREILGSLVSQPRRRLSPPAQSQRRLNHASNHRRTYCGLLPGDDLGGDKGGLLGRGFWGKVG